MANYGEAVFRHEGRLVDYTPGTAVAAGDVVALAAGAHGVAHSDIAANELGSLLTEGVFDVLKDGGTYAVGDIVNFDGSTIVPTGGAFFGRVVAAAAAGDARVRVKLLWATA